MLNTRSFRHPESTLSRQRDYVLIMHLPNPFAALPGLVF